MLNACRRRCSHRKTHPRQRSSIPLPTSGEAGQVPVKKYPPTPEELREWMDKKGLSNKAVAKALRLSDGRVVRVWTSKKEPTQIPYPSWYTLRHKFGK